MAYPYNTHPFYSSSTPSFYSTNTTHTPPFPTYPYYNPSFYSTTTTPITSPTPNIDFHHGYTPPSPNPCPSYVSNYPSYPSQQQTQPQPNYTYQHLPTPTIPPPSPPQPNPYSTPMRASPTQESSQRSANELFQASKNFTDKMIDKVRAIQEELQASHLSIQATFQEMRGTLANQPQKLHAILQKHLQEKNEKEDEFQKDEDPEELAERDPEEQTAEAGKEETAQDLQLQNRIDDSLDVKEPDVQLDGPRVNPDLQLLISEKEHEPIFSVKPSLPFPFCDVVLLTDVDFFGSEPPHVPPLKPPDLSFVRAYSVVPPYIHLHKTPASIKALFGSIGNKMSPRWIPSPLSAKNTFTILFYQPLDYHQISMLQSPPLRDCGNCVLPCYSPLTFHVLHTKWSALPNSNVPLSFPATPHKPRPGNDLCCFHFLIPCTAISGNEAILIAKCTNKQECTTWFCFFPDFISNPHHNYSINTPAVCPPQEHNVFQIPISSINSTIGFKVCYHYHILIAINFHKRRLLCSWSQSLIELLLWSPPARSWQFKHWDPGKKIM